MSTTIRSSCMLHESYGDPVGHQRARQSNLESSEMSPLDSPHLSSFDHCSSSRFLDRFRTSLQHYAFAEY